MSITKTKTGFGYYAKGQKKWVQVFAYTKKEAKKEIEQLGYFPKSSEIFVGLISQPRFD